MQIVLHIGAHFTDEGKLLKSLGKNREHFSEHGISLPKPRSYRTNIRKTLNDVHSVRNSEAREAILLGMIDESVDSPDRVILSNDNFICVPRMAVRLNLYYPNADERLADLCNLFHGDDIEIFMSIRNPATYLPALLAGIPEENSEELTEGLVATALRWSETIRRIRKALPNVSLTVWCNEDTPIIWEELLREMSGLEATQPLAGGDDLLNEIMSPEGMDRYADYLEKHPDLNQMQKRRVIAAFLDKFALDEEVEEELDFPGWTDEFIEALTDIYDEDVYEISRIPGVTLITP
ncbi:hypothetical protein [uncultured Shimia sp.]|uniref:hypothetical protein n=1 Tax=uncultured Shimia sp. TaxID=573152 RepID=UPI00261CF6C9|nr:hypothetical protein [uncultured Shimia sp.]